jgi:predicted transcriptional regulator
MPDIDQTKTLLGLTVQIVSAHVSNNQVPTARLPTLIQQVYAALSHTVIEVPHQIEPEKTAPAVAPKKSVFPDYIICLEDGRRMKTLKRHLRSTYDMSPEQYREKWDLPPDYPMVAPSYAARRSKLAKQLGLGRRAAAAEEIVEKQEPLEQMPARPWQIVSAPEPAAPPPAPERKPEPTLDSVFGRFPKAAGEIDETEAPAEAAEGAAPGQRRAARKPFSKQLARTMRP